MQQNTPLTCVTRSIRQGHDGCAPLACGPPAPKGLKLGTRHLALLLWGGGREGRRQAYKDEVRVCLCQHNGCIADPSSPVCVWRGGDETAGRVGGGDDCEHHHRL
jgi:hypothetical protein